MTSPPNFSGKNLQGCSFLGQNLAGANFNRADIRGADFRGAALMGATFQEVQAGISPRPAIYFTIATCLLSVVIGFVAAFITVFAGYLLFPFSIKGDSALASLLVFALAIIVGSVMVRRGLEAALGAALIAGVGCGALLGYAAGGLNALISGVSAVTITALIAVLMIIVDVIVVTATTVIAGRIAGLIAIAMLVVGSSLGARVGTSLGVAVAQVLAVGNLTAAKVSATTKAETAAIVGSLAGACLIGYISKRTITGDSKFALIWKSAIAGAAIGGTRFQNANLTDAVFLNAVLPSTDFRNANLTRTNFHQAKWLDRARVGYTILENPLVRALLVTHQGQHQSYVGENLKGANLAGAALTGADFTEANLSDAMLEGAILEHSILLKAQAIGTNFRSAQFTGACIEAWNIDSTTQIEDVICDYIYLRNSQQERRPSSGAFAPGDFTELFEEIIHTLDLIFRNGVDQKAFNYSLHQLQVENQGMALPIRSLEKKSNGVVVVRVDVPAKSNKSKLHADFSSHYELALNAIVGEYKAVVQAKDEQIKIYRSQLSDWKEVVRLLANCPDRAVNPPQTQAKLVVLDVGEGDLNVGFPVALQISTESRFRVMQSTKGRLAPAPELSDLYAQWRLTYRKCLNASFRLDVPDTQITNISRQDFFQDCLNAANQLQQALNHWLKADSFRSIKERLLEQLAPSESIRIVLQTNDRQLRRLPFQRWEFFDRYHQAEMALSTPDYELIKSFRSAYNRVNILAILGDSTGINVQHDRALLNALPNAAVTFLVEPPIQLLNDQLWEQSWDILFFAGHSSSQTESDTGQISLNQNDRLTVPQLKYALRKAIAQGLKLAVFNSCDGLGLARELADLHLPYMIVMREPVPDQVAQEFLKHFLSLFSSSESLYQSVREAREKLQGVEDRFPCATWLPVICQNPSASPLTWQHLQSG